MKLKIAIVRGAFLNKYEMQFYEPLIDEFDITAFASQKPFHDNFKFPVVKLPCPMDLPDFPYKMPILNRLFTDAHYLPGLEDKLKGFDLVHSAETYYRYTQQSLNAKRKGYVKKVVATVLENISFNNEGIWGRKAFKKRSRKELDAIIALTNKTKDVLLTEGADPKKITVISHFIDTKRFTPDSKRSQLTNKNRFTILFCGRLEIYKGVFDILEAAKILKSDADLKKFSISFRFVGSGSQMPAMLQFEKENGLDRIVSHTQVLYSQMPEIYRQADIYAAPSIATKTWEEQYNTSLLEAQAAGLPIVTTNSGGIPENVGDAALVVPPGDVFALAGGIKRLIIEGKFRSGLAKKARARAVTVHDIKIGAGKLRNLYRKIMEIRLT
jgi:alpha-maltose-1-phosphate synthase